MKSVIAIVNVADDWEANAAVAGGVNVNESREPLPPPADPIDAEERRAPAVSTPPAPAAAAALPAASCSFFCLFASASLSFFAWSSASNSSLTSSVLRQLWHTLMLNPASRKRCAFAFVALNPPDLFVHPGHVQPERPSSSTNRSTTSQTVLTTTSARGPGGSAAVDFSTMVHSNAYVHQCEHRVSTIVRGLQESVSSELPQK